MFHGKKLRRHAAGSRSSDNPLIDLRAGRLDGTESRIAYAAQLASRNEAAPFCCGKVGLNGVPSRGLSATESI